MTLYLFDLDGTLVETPSWYIHEVAYHAARASGCNKSFDPDEFWFSPNVDDYVKSKTSKPDLFWQKLREMDTARTRREAIRPYADVHILNELIGPKGIITSAPKPISEAGVSCLNIFFEILINAQPIYGFERKPSPHALFYASNQIGVSLEKLVFVGNGEEDIEMARNAGVISVFIDRGEYACGLKIKPDYLVNGLEELFGLPI